MPRSRRPGSTQPPGVGLLAAVALLAAALGAADETPRVAALLAAAAASEARHDPAGAIPPLREALAQEPDDPHLRWRLARALLRSGELVVGSDAGAALALYREAREEARRGSALDRSCGECCLYEFATTARIATTAGLLRSLFDVRALGPLLDRCLANPPRWREADWNTEEGNLYFGASHYYRLLPDSWLVGFVVGRRGDAARAVGFARRASEVSPTRVDYRVELATALLCLAERSDDAAAREEGRALLAALGELPDLLPTDRADRERARRLEAHPHSACEWARFVDVEPAAEVLQRYEEGSRPPD